MSEALIQLFEGWGIAKVPEQIAYLSDFGELAFSVWETVYAPALELGIVTPATVYDDYPVQVLGGSAWPVNSYGYFRGRMNVAEAVEDSSNPVAVRVFQELTPELSFQFTQDKFGISTLESGREANGN